MAAHKFFIDVAKWWLLGTNMLTWQGAVLIYIIDIIPKSLK